jgi:hypothetical protein
MTTDPPTGYIDAYCHIGRPRFGTTADAIAVFDLYRIRQGVLVLGPDVPDYPLLLTALAEYGERVRGIGIPFGQTERQIASIVALQLRAGVIGLRVEPSQVQLYPAILDLVGERGRWIYMIDPLSSLALIQTLLDWLHRYPEARLAAPHFVHPHAIPETGQQGKLTRALLSHPHFHPIFSRHGGMGSQEPYPHPDLAAWVKQVVKWAGMDRIMWGSEYPVFYWRDENMSQCQAWLSALDIGLSPQDLAAFWSGNARRLIFDVPSPVAQPVSIPPWVNEQFELDRTLPLFPRTEIDLPMRAYQVLHHHFVQSLQEHPHMTFSQFVTDQLVARARDMEQGS